ncbi:MAG TPA: RsfA family transcriptional regulator [Virgibacillus sp.]|nr:RsfA family transcriptional regulator [Virgibacillus sp.]
MNSTRQDAWSKDEDVLLAETVLRYIREGKTQLEAFKNVAKQLSRTPAACGFRWNATIRKQYNDAIQQAKDERKRGSQLKAWNYVQSNGIKDRDTLETAILLLKEMQHKSSSNGLQIEHQKMVKQLEEENARLKEQLSRYDEAWNEMGNLWKWVKTHAIMDD